MNNVTVKYIGPPDQQCHELAEVTGGGSALLEHGATFSVPQDFAERLIHTSAQFELADKTPPAPTKAELRARAAELGLELPKSAKVAAIASAIAEAEAAAAVEPEPVVETETPDLNDGVAEPASEEA